MNEVHVYGMLCDIKTQQSMFCSQQSKANDHGKDTQVEVRLFKHTFCTE